MIWLISEIVLPIIVAGILGLAFGIWVANRYFDRKVQARDAQIAQLKLERDNAAANRPASGSQLEVPPVRAPATDKTSRPKPIHLDEASDDGNVDSGKDRKEPTLATAAEDAPVESGVKPAGIAAARNGKADDLRAISGVGPKIEESLHEMGIYHYDQIAGWSEANAAWVDGFLKFTGRVGREKWIEQAQELASNEDG
jgi:NADH-quinone oxidoreductase subunit E